MVIWLTTSPLIVHVVYGCPLKPIELTYDSEAFKHLKASLDAFHENDQDTEELIFKSCRFKKINPDLFKELKLEKLSKIEFNESRNEIDICDCSKDIPKCRDNVPGKISDYTSCMDIYVSKEKYLIELKKKKS